MPGFSGRLRKKTRKWAKGSKPLGTAQNYSVQTQHGWKTARPENSKGIKQ
jgi:hypothetical protein